MKKVLTILIVLIVVAGCSTAKWPTEQFVKKNNYLEAIGNHEEGDKKPDKYAMYPNGKKGIHGLIAKNINYPSKAKANNISGRVLVKYTVGVDGYVMEIEVIESVHPLLDAEAIRIIKLMKRWIPGEKDGEIVPILYRQPFNFKLK